MEQAKGTGAVERVRQPPITMQVALMDPQVGVQIIEMDGTQTVIRARDPQSGIVVDLVLSEAKRRKLMADITHALVKP